MPVPVPVHEGFSVHRAVKSQSILHTTAPPVTPESIFRDASNYVIHSACQPPTVQTVFPDYTLSQETRSNWPSFVPYSSGVSSRLPQRPGVGQEGPNLSYGLTAAEDVAISKLTHAETHPLPVLTSGVSSTAMGLQHCSDRRVADAFGIRCEVDAADLAPRSHPQGLSHDSGIPSYAQESIPVWESSRHPDSINAEHYRDGLLQRSATPFADFVDRIVATELSHGCDSGGHNDPPFLPPVVAFSHKHQPAPAVPVSNSSYIKAYRAMAEPLSEWMADFIWKACTDGVSLPRRFVGIGAIRTYGDKPSSSLAKSIHSVLCSTLLQPSAIVLALWYITRLPVLFDEQTVGVNLTSCELEFRKELYGDGRSHPAARDRHQLESQAPFRVALLGCMLANKWLDDHTFSNKTWHSISDVPIQSINRLELAALAALGHDLSVAAKAWEMWLAQLRCFPTPICRPSFKDSNAVARKMITDLAQLQDRVVLRASALAPEQPVFGTFLVDFDSTDEPCQIGRFDPFEIDLDEDGPLREEYVPRRRSSMKKDASQYSSVRANDDNMSPCEPPEWVSRTHWSYARYRGPYLQRAAPVQSLRGTLAHSHSDMASRDMQNEFERKQGLLLPYQLDLGNSQVNHDLFDRAVCPPAGHSRTSSNSSGSPAHVAEHFRSYSQTQVGSSDACCPLPIPCSRLVGRSTLFHGPVNACYFQPMWLKT
ncbi:hypothetical protein ACEPAI_5917 [Sanghuangporus weigelae]